MVRKVSYVTRPAARVNHREMDPIAHFKTQFHSPREFLHFNNAGNAPLSLPALRTIQNWSRRLSVEGAMAIPEAYREVEKVRAALSGFLGLQADCLGFFPSAAAALSQVALGLSLSPGDEILTWDQEYPSNHYPWREAAKRAGAKLIAVASGPDLETPVESLLAHVTERTKAIAMSWVQYRSGAITDLEKLTTFARARSIFTCADIIQGAGVLPFHFMNSGLDAACGGSHKWLLGAPSSGFMCLRPEHVETLSPIYYGAISFGTPDDPAGIHAQPKSDTHRFEPGSLPLLDIMALGASVGLLAATGIDRIAQEAEWLARRLMHGLRERGYTVHSPHGSHFRGAIVNFSPGADSKFKTPEDIDTALKKARVAFIRRPPGIRLSPHAFNTAEEVEAVLASLE
jgi:cysteine desulfurase / selenocysteine lyase